MLRLWFEILFGEIVLVEALTGEFVGTRDRDVFGDGLLVPALRVRVLFEVLRVLLDGFFDAE